MSGFGEWSRRRFLAASSAAAGLSAVGLPFDDAATAQEGNRIPPPIVITGGIRPLFFGNTARPLRYRPESGDFTIRNGGEFFNRPIYGPVSDFRVDAGDRPEFSLYVPGHGGNLKLGFITATGAKWAADADDVVARYSAGRMLYEIRDRHLGGGSLSIELLTAAEGSGLLVKIEAHAVAEGTAIAWAFGGVSGKKGRRNGDIGCEVEPVSQFFQLRSEECMGNVFSIGAGRSDIHAEFCDWVLSYPPLSRVGIQAFEAWHRAPSTAPTASTPPEFPVLTGSAPAANSPIYLTLRRVPFPDVSEPVTSVFARRSEQVAAIAATISIETPDPFIDAMGPALGIVADALWDEKQQCVMHGCVAWRAALAGWRGPYVLDATGAHDRARLHFRHWLRKQNVKPVTTGDPATGPADADMHLARKEGLLHSNGDLSNNHYDMNMVFFDVLLRHLRWTGDIEFAREIWPALQRHLAWERRLFRRTFTVDGKEPPLYEAYAAIWASDNLQYSGGGAAHSSAYNVFSFRFAAQLARLLGEDATPYRAEADAIEHAMRSLLWVPGQGAFAEAKDLMEPQTVYNNPALWTVYHTIDSEVPAPREACQICAERLAVLKRIPVEGEGVPPGNFMLACSDWLPYMWSLTLILLAENMHFALALWQAGMADEAYKIFKGALLDSMYMGLCPGDFHMTSALDPHRQEAQRDFGDPTGISARALVEGLFGVRPNLIGNQINLRPWFPGDWDRATMRHKDFDLIWHRQGQTETYEFTSRFARQVPLTLTLPARTTSLPAISSGGAAVPCSFDTSAVGAPMVTIALPPAASYRVNITWQGAAPTKPPAQRSYSLGAALELPQGVSLAQIDDPQGCLRNGKTSAVGFHTVFAKMEHGYSRWDMPISFEVAAATPEFQPVPKLHGRAEAVDLSAILTHRLTEMFAQSYAEPRSPLCTLSIPDTLMGGWANIDAAPKIDDTGLRRAGGMLKTPLGLSFRTPPGDAPNCVLLSWFTQHRKSVTVPLAGRASGLYLLLTGTTLPQCSHMQHALASAMYADGSSAALSLRNPETWWPIEQDYLLDDYLFVCNAPLPPRVSLRTGETRLLTYESFKGKGRSVPGGAATIVYLPLDSTRTLASLKFEVNLYGIVAALLGATLVRPS